MMNIIKYPKKAEWSQLLQRPQFDVADLENTVSGIFSEIQQKIIYKNKI